MVIYDMNMQKLEYPIGKQMQLARLFEELNERILSP